MKKLALGNPLGDFQKWASDALRTIERSSAEDVESIMSEFSVTSLEEPTPLHLRTFDASSADLATVRRVLATLIDDINKGGRKRSEPE
jgi:hypothetical protein